MEKFHDLLVEAKFLDAASSVGEEDLLSEL